MRVAYIISIAHGIDAWTYREIEYLQSRGIQVFLYPLRVRQGPYMPSAGWYIHPLNLLYLPFDVVRVFLGKPNLFVKYLLHAIKHHGLIYFLLACDFVVSLKNNKVELIHCVFGDHKFYVGYYCKALSGLPLSVSLYGYELKANPNWSLFIECLPGADVVIVNCEYNRDLIRKLAGDQVADRAVIIRHVAPVVKDNKYIRILTVGGFVYRKGHDLLFNAIKILLEKFPNIQVWVAGYSGDIDIKELAEKIGVSKNVTIFQDIPENLLEILYQTCDIFCLASRTVQGGVNEGLPVAIIEAMAHRKPVVASNLSGIPELLPDILVAEGDIEGLALALEQYIQDSQKRMMDGQRNYEIILENCSITNLQKLISLWRNNIKEGMADKI